MKSQRSGGTCVLNVLRKSGMVRSGMSGDELYESKWRWYSRLSFLHQHIAVKYTTMYNLNFNLSHLFNCAPHRCKNVLFYIF